MSIIVRYETLLKRAAGASSEVIEPDGSCDVRDVIRQIAARKDALEPLLLDETGEVRSSVLIFLGESQISASEPRALNDGDVITLMSPISGG